MKFLFFIFVSNLGFGATFEGYPTKGVSLYFDKVGMIKNEFCFPVSIWINRKNIELPGKSETPLGADSWTSWNWMPGTLSNIQQKVMKSPLIGKHTYEYGPGAGVHAGADKYGYDFSVPEGTRVVASEGGIVIRTVQGYAIGHQNQHMRDNANIVEILHADGTVARYVHLKQNSLRVSQCQLVQTGQEIALSGNTGYTKGPHLHMDVFKPVGGGTHQTIPLQFAP